MKVKTACLVLTGIIACWLFPNLAKSQSAQSCGNASFFAMRFDAPTPVPGYLGDTTPITPAWNSLFLEGAGSGLAYTLNYERLLSSSFGLRLGFGYLPVSAKNKSGVLEHASITSAPLTASWFPFSGGDTVSSDKLELGAGLSYVDLTKAVEGFPVVNSIGYTIIVGYRYQPYDGGVLFRVAFTPVILEGGFHAWGGISLGLGF